MVSSNSPLTVVDTKSQTDTESERNGRQKTQKGISSSLITSMWAVLTPQHKFNEKRQSEKHNDEEKDSAHERENMQR